MNPLRNPGRYLFPYFTILLLAFSAAPLALAQAPGGLTPQDVAQIRSVANVAMHPDGTRVAYALRVPRLPMVGDDGPQYVELHVVDSTGASRPYITGAGTVSNIAWTRDGKAISFTARRAGDKATALYVIPLDGGEARRVLAHDTSIAAYSWSHDGKRVAFVAEESAPAKHHELAGKGFNQEIYEEDVPYSRVWIAEVGSAEKPRMLALEGSASVVQWSPVDDRLAVVLAPTPLTDDDLINRRVSIVSAATGRVIALVNNPGNFGSVEWSPDGKALALLDGADRHDSDSARLYIIDPQSGALQRLLPDIDWDFSQIAWMNPARIAYIADEGVWTSFNRIERDGSGRHTIVATGGPIFTALSLSADGQSVAFIGESPMHPPEVYFMRHGDAAGPKRLTNGNPWLAQRRLAKQEPVKWKARDGVELEGILIRPLDEKPGMRYPFILTVHGGPESHDPNGWQTSYADPGQVAAARGYAVFYPNYRGSTGRGEKFLKLSQGDPAGKEFDDLADAVDHFVAIGLADKSKVGITGGSYGGYATAWCTTYYSEKFAAGVMFVGISNKISKVGTTDIANEEYYVHALHRPWEAWQMFLERSPIYHAGKSKTPVLIAGGLADPRVHPQQSMEMYRHLKLRSAAPVRLVRYPGEPHGNRRAASRYDYHLRMLQWFDHYLKGSGGPPPPMEIEYPEVKPNM
jgi:dipeptidyl aminopeptidase/acylaminoacyl peptidase